VKEMTPIHGERKTTKSSVAVYRLEKRRDERGVYGVANGCFL